MSKPKKVLESRVFKWRCSKCGKTWEIVAEKLKVKTIDANSSKPLTRIECIPPAPLETVCEECIAEERKASKRGNSLQDKLF